MRKIYIYVITTHLNNKKYVGASCRPDERFKSHIHCLRRGKHPNNLLQTDFDLYGEVFSHEVVCEKTQYRSESEEYKWMIQLKTYDERYGYNFKDWSMRAIRREKGLFP